VTTPYKYAPHPEFRSPDLRAKLGLRYKKVLKQFPKLPLLRLLCYFDDENPEELRQQFGQFTGIHTPIIGSGTWPHQVCQYFRDSGGGFAFDNLIYIPGTKYAQEEVSFAIIFAHELQHFVQFGFAPKVYKANTLLFNKLLSFEPTTDAKPWDIPYNREAMIVAKRAAESVCGVQVVKAFIAAQIADGKSSKNISKAQLWEWVRTLKPSTRYDLLKETDQLVQKYKPQLQGLKSDIDFSKAKWWL